jgi:rubrerythrin
MEGLSFAINMEIEGEGYYRHQAQKHRGTPLEAVFSALAEDESRHAALLRDSEMGEVTGKEDLSSNVFDGLAELKDMKVEPEEIDAYRLALKQEKKSIELYKRLHDETEANKELYEYIIAQEEDHYRTIEEIVKKLSGGRGE